MITKNYQPSAVMHSRNTRRLMLTALTALALSTQTMAQTTGDTAASTRSIADLTARIEIQPALPELYAQRAKAFEAIKDRKAARADYVKFARLSPPADVTAAARARLLSLGIDSNAEYANPFGDENPLEAMAENLLSQSLAQRVVAITPEAKAEAWSNVAACLDALGRDDEALEAIDRSIRLASDPAVYRQTRVNILASMNRLDEALADGEPLVAQVRERARSIGTVWALRPYRDALTYTGLVWLETGQWDKAIGTFADLASVSDADDQAHLATMYLFALARSGGKAKLEASLDALVQRAEASAPDNFRDALLLYWLGRAPLKRAEELLSNIARDTDRQDALAEIWFVAGARAKYLEHNETAVRHFRRQIDQLAPYGTIEWWLAKQELN